MKMINISLIMISLLCNLVQAQCFDLKKDEVNALSKHECSQSNFEPPYGKTGKEAATERIRQLIAHARANPVGEAPIKTHPVKKGQVFSRHYNITLSTRAYFQLHADPSHDSSSSQLIEKIAQYYLDHSEEIDDQDGPYWAGEYHSACVVKFGINGTERKGALARKSELVVLEYMLAFVNHWSRPEHYKFSLVQDTYFYWRTENHWWQEIVSCWGYLLALKNDPAYGGSFKLKDGKTIEEHYDLTLHYMKQHMNQRARKGFLLEISSGGYATRMQNMWLSIFELSPDQEARDLAKNTLDLYWAFWAEEQISGERGGGKVRHRGDKILNGGETIKEPAWIFFGTGNSNMEYIKSITGSNHELARNYIYLFSGYFPDQIVYEILEDRKNAPAYAIVQRRLGRDDTPNTEFPDGLEKEKARGYNYKEGDCLKYSWVSKNFILGTVMRPPEDVMYWEAGSGQAWAHGLLLQSEKQTTLPERVVPVMIGNDIRGGQYAIQSKGSFMTRKLPDAVSPARDNKLYPYGIFISKGLESYTKLSDDFIFINSPTTYVAVRAVGTGFVLSSHLLKEEFQNDGFFYKLEDDLQPLIIEAAEPGDYKNFEEFTDAVIGAQLVSENGTHSYASLSGNELLMYDDRSRPLIGGKKINYNPKMAYKSRYVKSKWDSGVIKISAGGMEKVLDFTIN